MRFLSLFSGIGGFDLAFTRVGFECAGMCEIDPQARAVLAHRFPGVPISEDVTKINGGTYGHVDVVCAGFPCQDLSLAGRRSGLDGERSGLFFEVVRIARECEARWVVLENVPGLLSSNDGRDMARVVWEFSRIGYFGAWRTLDAQYAGVAQRRARVLFAFSFGDASCAEILFEPESVRWNPAPRREEGEGTAADVAGCLDSCSGGADDNDAQRGLLIAEETASTLTAARKYDSAGKHGTGPINLIVEETAPALRAEGHDASEDGTGRHALVVVCPEVSPALKARDFKGPSSDGDGDGAPLVAVEGPTSRWRVRRLTPRECERLQGFPDDWTVVDYRGKPMADSPRYRMLGNAVAVPVAQGIADGLAVRRGRTRREAAELREA